MGGACRGSARPKESGLGEAAMRQVIMGLGSMGLGSDSRTALPLEETLHRRQHRLSRRRSGCELVSLTMLLIRKRHQRLFGTPSASLSVCRMDRHRGVSSSITP
jgi:hypothetical protein